MSSDIWVALSTLLLVALIFALPPVPEPHASEERSR
jgi:hypothetical protein